MLSTASFHGPRNLPTGQSQGKLLQGLVQTSLTQVTSLRVVMFLTSRASREGRRAPGNPPPHHCTSHTSHTKHFAENWVLHLIYTSFKNHTFLPPRVNYTYTSHIPTSKQRAAEPRRTQLFRDKLEADSLGSYLFQLSQLHKTEQLLVQTAVTKLLFVAQS